ncbi:MAG: hypothetical protein M5U01_03900 [Ardenticatenaceae bacterium]|nr:hypothetical protein [Ardenticatenaceae bacterium]HBY97432.1 hypothetical protein [Chloroflexota bacterium]
MRITMERDLCTTVLPACEECFATFVLHDCYPDRACITEVVDDGQAEVTLTLRYEGHEETLVITDENRELLAYEGWSQFVHTAPAFAHVQDQQPHG